MAVLRRGHSSLDPWLLASGGIVLASQVLIVGSRLDCLDFFRRLDDLLAFGVFLTSSGLLIGAARVSGRARPRVQVLAQLPVGVVLGMSLLPSSGLLVGGAAAAFAVRSLPLSKLALTAGFVLLLLGTLLGNLMLKLAFQLSDPALGRCP
jgi:hypothetical protein